MTKPRSECFSELYFESYYRSYDLQNPPRKLDYYKAVLQRYLRHKERPGILDFGCAFGHFLARLGPAYEASGVDVSDYAIGRAMTMLPNARLAVAADGLIPFDTRFDGITAWDVLEHIPDLDAVATDIGTHLAAAGVFVFVVPVYDGPIGPVVRLLDMDPTHVHRHSRRFWLAWVQRHFALIDWWGIFRYLLPGGYYAHWPTRALRRVAPAIAVVAQHKNRHNGVTE